MQSLQEFIIRLTFFINDTIIPFLFGLALLFFVWNAFRYLILNGNETAAREHAKNLMLYGIGAFVLLVSIWGIVNLLVNGLDLNSDRYVVPDYMLKSDYGEDDGDWWFSVDFNDRNAGAPSDCINGGPC